MKTRGWDQIAGILIISAGLSACGPKPIASAGCANNDMYRVQGSGEAKVWPKGTHVDMRYEGAFPKELRAPLDTAAQLYDHTLENVKLELDADSSLRAPRYANDMKAVQNDSINGVYWLNESDWKEVASSYDGLSPGTAAVTISHYNSDSISNIDIFYRADRFVSGTQSFASLVDSAKDFFMTYDLESTDNKRNAQHKVFFVGVHEMGHAVGLCHSTNPNDVMFKQSEGWSQEELRAEPFSDHSLKLLNETYGLAK